MKYWVPFSCWVLLCAFVALPGALAQEADSFIDDDSLVEDVSDIIPREILEEEETGEGDLPVIETPSPQELPPRIEPDFMAPEAVGIGAEVVFDATPTLLASPSEGSAVYSWDFGDGSRVRFGKQIHYTFQRPGLYDVRLSVKQGLLRESTRKQIIVFTRQAVLVHTQSEEKVAQIQEQAARSGIWLQKIYLEPSQSGLTSEENAIQNLQDNLDAFAESDLIIFWTEDSGGMQIFSQLWQRVAQERKFDTTQKLWVKISEGSLDRVARLTQPAFETLKPTAIILTRPEALNPLFEAPDFLRASDILQSRGIEFSIVDERSQTPLILILSSLMGFFSQNGVSQSVVYLLLAVPMINFLISFLRQVVGISTFGVYTPMMLALSFFILGLWFGLIVFFLVLIVSYIIRSIFERIELLYIPRVSLLLSVLSISFLFLLAGAVYFDVPVTLSLAVFPMMVMSTVSEKFLSAQTEGGLRNAVISTAETVLVALLAFYICDWDWMKNTILAMPELILLPLLGTMWLGRFTGLRLSEYIRFRSLLREDTQE